MVVYNFFKFNPLYLLLFSLLWVSCSDDSEEIKRPFELSISQTSFVFESNEAKFSFEVVANQEFEASSASWIPLSVVPIGENRYECRATISRNDGELRVGEIVLKDRLSDIQKIVLVQQNSYDIARFNPLKIFTDLSCSVLNTGITASDIDTISSPVHRRIAGELLSGQYSTFRSQIYKAYPHPNLESRQNKTGTHGLLDNPTGIYINSPGDLIIFADNLPQSPVKVLIQDADKGFGGQEYTLTSGVNKWEVNGKGLLYILYHTDDFKSAKTIKLNIASGEVNGYFDVSKHAAADWARLLQEAKAPYFDVLGKYAHLTFPTASFRSYTLDGKALIDAYDELVRLEMDFMGLFKYNRVFSNRLYFFVVHDSYMYATSFRTAYNIETMRYLCNVGELKTSSIWGPAHEVGHIHQTRPGLKWHGMTEVTNNIYSLFVQTQFGNVSRLQSENIYQPAMNSAFAGKLAHISIDNVFRQLVPFWQLYLYMTQVAGKNDFYKDVHEDIRKNASPVTDGECQLEFTKTCCRVAQLDLSSFFEKWGFFKPVDIEMDDYGKKSFSITQAQSTDIKQQINAFGYTPSNANIEYITDANLALYKFPRALNPGSVSQSNGRLLITGADNAVAYEVYNEDRLIAVSLVSSFDVKDWKDDFSVYAVPALGDKVKLLLKSF